MVTTERETEMNAFKVNDVVRVSVDGMRFVEARVVEIYGHKAKIETFNGYTKWVDAKHIITYN